MIRRPPRSTLFPYRRSSDLLVVPEVQELVEEVDEGSIGEHHDLVANGLIVRARVVDDAGDLPAHAAVRRARERRRALEAEADHLLRVDEGADRALYPIPDEIHEIRVSRVSGNRLFVIRSEERRVGK